MASNRVWNLMYVAGNTGRVVSDAANPQDRASALAGAATVEGNGWRVWVEHKDTGKRIFEKGAYQREDGIKPGDEVILVRGSRGRGPESGVGFEREIRALYIGGDRHNGKRPAAPSFDLAHARQHWRHLHTGGMSDGWQASTARRAVARARVGVAR